MAHGSRFEAPKAMLLSMAVLLLASYFLFEKVFETAVWSPRDEIAHFDYVDQLAGFKYPEPSSLISEHTALLCQTLDWSKPKSWNGSRRQMGLAGWSYESHNPPLYYALLAPVLTASKALGLDGVLQVMVLRSVTTLFWITGSILMLVLGEELYAALRVPRSFTFAVSLVVLLLNNRYVTTLGNDVLGLLISVGTMLFGARYLRTMSWGNLILLAFVASCAPLAKLTNSPLIFVPLAAVVFASLRQRQWRAAEVGIALTAAVPLSVFVGASHWRFGSILGSDEARRAFATFVEPIDRFPRFLSTITVDSFSGLGALSVSWDQLATGLWVLLTAGAVQSVYFLLRSRRRSEATLHLVCVAVALAVVGFAWWLNLNVPGVHWHAFRHYYWTLPFWTFAFLAFPVRVVHALTMRMTRVVARLRARPAATL